MPDTDISTVEHDSPANVASGEAVSDSRPSDRTEEWHERLASHGETLHQDMVEAREILHTGLPSDAIELANRDVQREASEAAARWRTSAHA